MFVYDIKDILTGGILIAVAALIAICGVFLIAFVLVQRLHEKRELSIKRKKAHRDLKKIAEEFGCEDGYIVSTPKRLTLCDASGKEVAFTNLDEYIDIGANKYNE